VIKVPQLYFAFVLAFCPKGKIPIKDISAIFIKANWPREKKPCELNGSQLLE